MRQRLYIVLLLIGISGVGYGNVQHGYVKTIARENKPSQRVNMVTINLRDNQVLLSDSTALGNGTFEFETKNEYGFTSIRKTGYSIVDKDLLVVTKTYTSTPVEILVYNIADKEKEKQEYAERQMQVAYTHYQEQIAILKQQLVDHIQSEEQVRQKSLELRQTLAKFQDMVENISEYYALRNYDKMDSVEISIDKAMKAGDVNGAYRLIMQEINLNTIVADIRREDTEIDAEIAEQYRTAQMIMANANAKDSLRRRNKDKVETILYDLSTIYLSWLQFDSAVYAMRLRADIDTTNVATQLDYAKFLNEYMRDKDEAWHYTQRAERQVERIGGEYSLLMLRVLNEKGHYLYLSHQYAAAVDVWNKAVNLSIKLCGKDHKYTATRRVSLAASYCGMRKYKLAKQQLNEALRIYHLAGQEDAVSEANALNNLASIFCAEKKYVVAKKYMEQAVNLLQSKDPNTSTLPRTLANMAAICTYVGDKEAVDRYYQEAYAAAYRILGEDHDFTLRMKSIVGKNK